MPVSYTDDPTVLSSNATVSSRHESLGHPYWLSLELTQSEILYKHSIKNVLGRNFPFATEVLEKSLEFLDSKDSKWKELRRKGLIVRWRDGLGGRCGSKVLGNWGVRSVFIPCSV